MDSNRKERISWYLYDWGNSAFYTSVVTVFIGPYLTEITKSAASVSGYVYPLGIKIYADAFFPYIVSISVILQVFILPILGAIADYTNLKKYFLGIFAYIGSFSVMAMYFLEGDHYLFGGLLFIIANLAFGASEVFYNAYLNEIAESEHRRAISSIGWAIGYIGGGLVLALNLILLSKAELFNISTGYAIRICLSSAGLWWAIFTIFPMLNLKIRHKINKIPKNENLFSISFKQLFRTIKEIPNYPQTLIFLIAYLLYNDGVQAVIALSGQFGQEELHLKISTLTTVILLVQFVAFIGTIIFNYIAKWFTSKSAIIFSLFIWVFAIAYAYFYLRTETDFYYLGIMIGLVLGSTQALSRSVYSQLIPAGKESEYFSLYEVSDKGTSWIGPLLFGLSLSFTGSYRIAILSLVILFVLGLIILFKVNINKGIEKIKMGVVLE